MNLSLEVARQVVRRVHLEAGALHLRPLTVVVLDAGGHVIVAERADNSPFGLFEIARAKAYGALALGMSSRSIMDRAEAQPYFVASATAALGGRLMPVPGGVLIHDGEKNPVGALGVSGDLSDNDELVGVKAVNAMGLTAHGH
ncbi:heme-binding protein [Nocardioides sp. CN2-186]|uniref:GlcG/HbpS family heme-binding protein n=1 Tax=Nocardioides tweenelious TaxID=3156607 RepID=UPI0032B5ED3D